MEYCAQGYCGLLRQETHIKGTNGSIKKYSTNTTENVRSINLHIRKISSEITEGIGLKAIVLSDIQRRPRVYLKSMRRNNHTSKPKTPILIGEKGVNNVFGV